MAKAKKTDQQEPIEKQLWKAADKLRKNIDAAENKHLALGFFIALFNFNKCKFSCYQYDR